MKNLFLHNMFKYHNPYNRKPIQTWWGFKDPYVLTAPLNGGVCTEVIHVPSYKRKGKTVSAYDRICGRRHSQEEHRRTLEGTYLKSQGENENQQNLEENQDDNINENNQESAEQGNEKQNEIPNENDGLIKLNESISARYAASEDTMIIKGALAALGYYDLNSQTGRSPYADQALFDAIKAFQADNKLPVTGTIMPDSPFLDALNAQFGLSVSTPREIALSTYNTGILPVRFDKEMSKAIRKICDKIEKERVPVFKNDQELMDYFYNIIKQPTHENYKDYPYVDTTGNVTFGAGINAGGRDDFKKITMQIRDANGSWREAEDSEKGAEYDRIMQIYKGNHDTKAQGYKGNIRIPEEVSKPIAYQRMEKGLTALRSERKFSNEFDRMHPEGKLVLLDMIYNMGAGNPLDDNRDPKAPKSPGNGPKGLTYKNWERFFNAIKVRDYIEAAKQSHRRGISKERNDWARDMMQKGGKVLWDNWPGII